MTYGDLTSSPSPETFLTLPSLTSLPELHTLIQSLPVKDSSVLLTRDFSNMYHTVNGLTVLPPLDQVTSDISNLGASHYTVSIWHGLHPRYIIYPLLWDLRSTHCNQWDLGDSPSHQGHIGLFCCYVLEPKSSKQSLERESYVIKPVFRKPMVTSCVPSLEQLEATLKRPRIQGKPPTLLEQCSQGCLIWCHRWYRYSFVIFCCCCCCWCLSVEKNILCSSCFVKSSTGIENQQPILKDLAISTLFDNLLYMHVLTISEQMPL